MVVYDAPIDNKNSGITLYTILVDVSVKKLVSPVKKAFFSKPNTFFLSFMMSSGSVDFYAFSKFNVPIGCNYRIYFANYTISGIIYLF
jgi:hypothetical protein